MEKILVPLDGTELSESALPLADRLATALDAELVLVSVSQLSETSAQAQATERTVGEYLERASTRVSRPARSYVEQAGEPVRGILEVVEAENPVLVVMATHARNPFGELLQGSVSQELLESSRVPLVLVPEGAATPS